MLKPAAAETWNTRAAAHLLNRAGFGGSPQQIDALFKLGRQGAIQGLLSNPDETSEFSAPAWMNPELLAEKRREFMEARRSLGDLGREEREKRRREMQRKNRMEQRKMNVESVSLWLKRMHSSKAPAREKMTLFWHGHFATAFQKVKSPVLMYQQNALFRDHAMGNFQDLTRAVSGDPAMMLYLDTDKNAKGKPNENFARELLELFTLGEGNYTETDIKEAARAFTGYQLNRRSPKPRFNPRKHDRGEKTFMGKTGRFKADDIVDIVFEQPRCAEYMVSKLWEFFAYESPEKEIVDALAAGFRKSEYAIKPLLEAIFSSEAFYSKKAIRTHIKSPVQLIVQMSRELELPEVPARPAAGAMQQLGQVLFNPPNVAGWEGGKSWINTSTLLARYNIAGVIVKGTLPGMGMGQGRDRMMDRRGKDRPAARRRKTPDLIRLVPEADRQSSDAVVKSLVERLFHTDLPARDLKQFREYADTVKGRKWNQEEMGELVHLMMSTPQYQLA